jgi:hypothetical protein
LFSIHAAQATDLRVPQYLGASRWAWDAIKFYRRDDNCFENADVQTQNKKER